MVLLVHIQFTQKLANCFYVASDLGEFVTLLVHQELTVVTLETLMPQAPDAVVAVSAKGFSIEPFSLEGVPVDCMNFSPSPDGPFTVDALWK